MIDFIPMPRLFSRALHASQVWFTRLIRRRFFLLFLFLLASIVLYPYAESSGPGYYAFRILVGGVILLTVYAVTVLSRDRARDTLNSSAHAHPS